MTLYYLNVMIITVLVRTNLKFNKTWYYWKKNLKHNRAWCDSVKI